VNVTLELLDLMLLLSDERLTKSPIETMPMTRPASTTGSAAALVGDELHALLDRGIGRHREHRGGHDVLHRVSLEDRPRRITLRA